MRAAIIITAVLSLGVGQAPTAPAPVTKPVQMARIMCFKTGEEAPPGFTKICYYDCLGSRVAITISSISLCPLTIER